MQCTRSLGGGSFGKQITGSQKTGDPVKNKELLQEILAEAERHRVSFQWVKGHAGNLYNERADLIAQTATRTLYQEWKAQAAKALTVDL